MTENLTHGKHRRISRRPIEEFHVAITYCDGSTDVLKHEGDDHLEQAVGEYTAMLKDAIDPRSLYVRARHVRLVTLIAYDDNARPVHHIDSGLFPCQHTEGDEFISHVRR